MVKFIQHMYVKLKKKEKLVNGKYKQEKLKITEKWKNIGLEWEVINKRARCGGRERKRGSERGKDGKMKKWGAIRMKPFTQQEKC